MFPEHVERSFSDPEYSFDEYFQLGSRRKVGPIKNQLASPNNSNYVREETFAQLRTGLRMADDPTTGCLNHLRKKRSVVRRGISGGNVEAKDFQICDLE